MLTLKEPMKLHTCAFPLAVPEAFHEKIMGNYALLGAGFGPKDLLFLLTAPPELPDDLGGMTTLHLQTDVTDVRSVTLNVINHVINRILLAESGGFTYQDQVYITNALQKLGVTDVSTFLSEVRALREEERSVATLLALYREEARAVPAVPAGTLPGRPAPEPERAGGADRAGPAPRYYLHSDVYRRLRTGDVYAALNAYRQSLSQVSPAARSQSLRLSEELRVSNLLCLSQLRAQTVEAAPLTLHQRVNHYEVGDLLPPPADAEAVLSQASEAALFSTVEHVLVQNLSRSLLAGDVWQDLRQALGQTVENTLSRYETYHSQAEAASAAGERAYHSLLTGLYREEEHLLRTLRENRTEREREVRAGTKPGPTALPGTPARLEHVALTVEGDAAESNVQIAESRTAFSNQDIANLTKNLLEAGPPTRPAGPMEAAPPVPTPEPVRAAAGERLETVRTGTLRSLRELSGLERELTVFLQEPAPVRELLLSSVRYGRPGTEERGAGAEWAAPPMGAVSVSEGGKAPVTLPSGGAAPASPAGEISGYPPEALVHRAGEAEGPGTEPPVSGVHTEPGPASEPQRGEPVSRTEAQTALRAGTERPVPAAEAALERAVPGTEEKSGLFSAPAALLRETISVETSPAGEHAGPSLLHPTPLPGREEERASLPPDGRPGPAGEALRREREYLLERVRETGRPAPADRGGEAAAPAGLPGGERGPVERIQAPPVGSGPAAAPDDITLSAAEILRRERERLLEQAREAGRLTIVDRVEQSDPAPGGVSAGAREPVRRVPAPEGGEEASAAPADGAPLSAGAVLRRERERLLEQAREAGHPAPPDRAEPTAAPGGTTPGGRELVERILTTAGTEARETLLLRELDRLDRRNREITERLRESRSSAPGPAQAATPDRARTMADALRAMDAPGQVLRELLEGPPAPARPGSPAAAELLLRHTDPGTRALLEQAMRFGREPEAGAGTGQGALRPGVLGALNAEAAQRQRETLELTARLGEPSGRGPGASAPGPGGAGGREALLNAAGRTGRPAREPEDRRSPLRFVHKREQEFLSAELLTRLEEQRRTASLRQETAAETTTRRSTARTEINDLTQQMTAQTTEDLTALVSRTLARQMGTITDRVYQQMEKRLQTERYRRGRF